MVALTIDGRRTSVEDGTTILQAARQLDIDLPTLCLVECLPSSASCFLCAVEVEGRPNLIPACAIPAADGMVVTTDSVDLRAHRKMALELLLSDHPGDCIAPCRTGCPARLDIPGFITRLATGRYQESAAIVTDFLTLPGSLGRICPRLCEARCHNCDVGEPQSIGTLHRFVADRDHASGATHVPAKATPTGTCVAIVGAGPAGLAAADHLLRLGHAATLFDAHAEPGGMLRWGVPAFRLPRDVIAREAGMIRALGGEFRMQRRMGRDFSLDDLRREFDAVFLAIGAQGSRALGCPGDDLAMPAIDLLAKVAGGRPPDVGPSVVVVGGGDTAMDAARTAVRLGASVTVLYRRSRRDMPCLMSQVEAAEAEGVHLQVLAAPVRLEGTGNGALRLTCVRMDQGPLDERGRARPIPIPGSEFVIETSSIIAAVGQSVDAAALAGTGLALSDRGIAADPLTLATNLPGVFAGGDGVVGADVAVRAVAAGKLAARSIDQYVSGQPIVGDRESVNVLMGRLDEDEIAVLFRRIETSPRTDVAQMPVARRVSTFEEVELGLDVDAAVRESRRCLKCGCWKAGTCELRRYATEYDADPLRFDGARRPFQRDATHGDVVYEPGKCILCGACVAVAANERPGVAFVGRGFQSTVAVPLGGSIADGLPISGRRVAEVCPTGAFSLIDNQPDRSYPLQWLGTGGPPSRSAPRRDKLSE